MTSARLVEIRAGASLNDGTGRLRAARDHKPDPLNLPHIRLKNLVLFNTRVFIPEEDGVRG